RLPARRLRRRRRGPPPGRAPGRGRRPPHRLGPHPRRARLGSARPGAGPPPGRRRPAAAGPRHLRARQRHPGGRGPAPLQRAGPRLPGALPGHDGRQQRLVQLHLGEDAGHRHGLAPARGVPRPADRLPGRRPDPVRLLPGRGRALRRPDRRPGPPDRGGARGRSAALDAGPGRRRRRRRRPAVHHRAVLRGALGDRRRQRRPGRLPRCRDRLLQRHPLGHAQRRPRRPAGAGARRRGGAGAGPRRRRPPVRHRGAQPLAGGQLRPGLTALGRPPERQPAGRAERPGLGAQHVHAGRPRQDRAARRDPEPGDAALVRRPAGRRPRRGRPRPVRGGPRPAPVAGPAPPPAL
ncbi:MAG: Aldehyde dehydrogenase, partial [uncultured Friedmanniella sp.]